MRGTPTAPVLVLADTKTSKGHGGSEYVAIEDPAAVILIHWLVKRRSGVGPLWTGTPSSFRTLWRKLMEGIGLPADLFTPYCLRRGGATFDFCIHGSLDRALERGRWQNGRTAKIYIRQGEELLSRTFFSAAQNLDNDALRLMFLHFVQRAQREISGG